MNMAAGQFKLRKFNVQSGQKIPDYARRAFVSNADETRVIGSVLSEHQKRWWQSYTRYLQNL